LDRSFDGAIAEAAAQFCRRRLRRGVEAQAGNRFDFVPQRRAVAVGDRDIERRCRAADLLHDIDRDLAEARRDQLGPDLVGVAMTVRRARQKARRVLWLEGDQRIGDGAIYAGLPIARFPITWTNLADAAEAYDSSIAYDLQVIVDYVDRFVASDALVIVLGDHQPVADVTRFSGSSAVPIHVWSRNPAFIAPFRARGYTPGLRPARVAPPRGMETFLPDLLADFSTPSGR